MARSWVPHGPSGGAWPGERWRRVEWAPRAPCGGHAAGSFAVGVVSGRSVSTDADVRARWAPRGEARGQIIRFHSDDVGSPRLTASGAPVGICPGRVQATQARRPRPSGDPASLRGKGILGGRGFAHSARGYAGQAGIRPGAHGQDVHVGRTLGWCRWVGGRALAALACPPVSCAPPLLCPTSALRRWRGFGTGHRFLSKYCLSDDA